MSLSRAATAVNEDYQRYPMLTLKGGRDELGKLICEIRHYLPVKVSDGALLLWQAMAAATRPQDWSRPDREPICYHYAVELAKIIGRVESTVRRYEAELVRAKLIEKRVGANGARSKWKGQGIVFNIAINRVAEFQAAKAQAEADRREMGHLCGKRGITKRAIRLILDDLPSKILAQGQVKELIADYEAWPEGEQLHRMSLEVLRDHVDATNDLYEQLLVIINKSNKTTGGPLNSERCHIQGTTQDSFVTCNASVEMTSVASATQDNSSVDEPNGASKCLEKNSAEAEGKYNTGIFGNLGSKKIYHLCSDDFRQMYLDPLGRKPHQLSLRDFIVAGHDLMHALGIHPSAWTEAIDYMSESDALLCLIILDARRCEPGVTIFSYGSYFRGMVRKTLTGELHLMGSIIGLSRRLNET